MNDSRAVPSGCERNNASKNTCHGAQKQRTNRGSNKPYYRDDNDMTCHTGLGDSYLRCGVSVHCTRIVSLSDSPIPPTALVTDTAAVRIPSAIVKLVPKRAFCYVRH